MLRILSTFFNRKSGVHREAQLRLRLFWSFTELRLSQNHGYTAAFGGLCWATNYSPMVQFCMACSITSALVRLAIHSGGKVGWKESRRGIRWVSPQADEPFYGGALPIRI